MLSMFRKKHLPTVLSICLLAVVMPLVGGCDEDAEQLKDAGQLPCYKVQGPVQVLYAYQASDTGSGSSPNKSTEVEEIIFFDKYVIIQETNGRARLIPVDKIMYFRWGKTL